MSWTAILKIYGIRMTKLKDCINCCAGSWQNTAGRWQASCRCMDCIFTSAATGNGYPTIIIRSAYVIFCQCSIKSSLFFNLVIGSDLNYIFYKFAIPHFHVDGWLHLILYKRVSQFILSVFRHRGGLKSSFVRFVSFKLSKRITFLCQSHLSASHGQFQA